MPAAAKNSGKSPHAMPSLRLLTSPAWLTLERFRSSSVVRQKTSRWRRRPLRRRRCERATRVRRDACVSRTSEHDSQPDDDEHDAEVERLRPQPVARGDPAGGQRAPATAR